MRTTTYLILFSLLLGAWTPKSFASQCNLFIAPKDIAFAISRPKLIWSNSVNHIYDEAAGAGGYRAMNLVFPDNVHSWNNTEGMHAGLNDSRGADFYLSKEVSSGKNDRKVILWVLRDRSQKFIDSIEIKGTFRYNLALSWYENRRVTKEMTKLLKRNPCPSED